MRPWMTGLRTSFILALICVLQVTSAFAQNSTQSALVSREDERPTASELMALPGALEDLATHTVNQTRIQSIVNGMPLLIAAIEKTYPGAIIGFLGRDTSLLANGMETFFVEHGQFDRVRYIDLSTPIFNVMSAEQLTRYMLGLGVSDQKENGRPFVMVDYTSLSANSQSTQLLRALTSHFKAKGFSSQEIVDRFNILSLGVTSSPSWVPLQMTPEQIQTAKKNQIAEIDLHGQYSSIMTLGADYQAMAYSKEWHDRFVAFRVDEKGVIIPYAKVMKSEAARIDTLAEQVALINAIRDPSSRIKMDEQLKQYEVALNPDPNTPANLSSYLKERRLAIAKAIRGAKKRDAESKRDQKRLEYLEQRKLQFELEKLVQEAPILTEANNDITNRKMNWYNLGKLGPTGVALMNVLYHASHNNFHTNWAAKSPLRKISFATLFDLFQQNKLDKPDMELVFLYLILNYKVIGLPIEDDSLRIIAKNENIVLPMLMEKVNLTVSPQALDALVTNHLDQLKDLKKYAPRMHALLIRQVELTKKKFQREAKARRLVKKESDLQREKEKYTLQRQAQTEFQEIANQLQTIDPNVESERFLASDTFRYRSFTANGLRLVKLHQKYAINQNSWWNVPDQLSVMTMAAMIRLYEAGKIDAIDMSEMFTILWYPEVRSRTFFANHKNLADLLQAHPRATLKMTLAFLTHQFGKKKYDQFESLLKTLKIDGFINMLPPHDQARIRLEEERFQKIKEQVQRERRQQAQQNEMKYKRNMYLYSREHQKSFAEFVQNAVPVPADVEARRSPIYVDIARNVLFSETAHAFLNLYMKSGGPSQRNQVAPSPLKEIMAISMIRLFEQGKIDTMDLRQLFDSLILPLFQQNALSEDLRQMFREHSQTMETAAWEWANAWNQSSKLEEIEKTFAVISKDWPVPEIVKEKIRAKRLQLVRDEQQKRKAQRLKLAFDNKERAKKVYVQQRDLQDSFTILESTLPKLSDSEDPRMEYWTPDFGGEIKISDNGRAFAETYMRAYNNFGFKIRLDSPDISPLTQMAMSTLLNLYERDQLGNRDLKRLFELILAQPAGAGVQQIPKDINDMLVNRRNSRAVRYIFGSEKNRKAFPEQEFLTKAPNSWYHVSTSKANMRRFYDAFIQDNNIGYSCQQIYSY